MKLTTVLTLLISFCFETAHVHAQQKIVLRTQHGSVTSLAFSADGYLLAAGCSGKKQGAVVIWNLKTAQLEKSFTGYVRYGAKVEFSPNNQDLAVVSNSSSNKANDGKIEMRQVASGDVIWSIVPHDWDVATIRFSPDSKILALSCGDGMVRLWDAQTGILMQTLDSGSNSQVNTLAFSADGRTLIVNNWELQWWQQKAGKFVLSRLGSKVRVNTIFFTNGGKVLLTGWPGVVICWNANDGKKIKSFRLQKGEGEFQDISPDGQWVAGSYDLPFVMRETEVGLWEAQTGKLVNVFKGHKGSGIRPIAFSPDGHTLAAGADDWIPDDAGTTTVFLWQLPKSKTPN